MDAHVHRHLQKMSEAALVVKATTCKKSKSSLTMKQMSKLCFTHKIHKMKIHEPQPHQNMNGSHKQNIKQKEMKHKTHTM